MSAPVTNRRGVDRVAVRWAETDEERRAVYRFRYHTYIEELGKHIDGADHDGRQLHDEEDDAPGTVLLYTGSPDEITGTLRITTYAGADVPDRVRRRYGSDPFNGAAFAESARLMVAKTCRGGAALAALARTAYRHITATGSELTLAYCAPGLVALYRRLGYRPYRGDLIDTPDGLRIPLINLMADAEFYRAVRSPLLPDLLQAFPAGADLTPYRGLIADRPGNDDNTEPVDWSHLWQTLIGASSDCCQPDLAAAVADGCFLRVADQQVVTRTHRTGEDVFIVLDGTFEETTADGHQIRLWTRGDIVGAGPLHDTPTVLRAVTGGRLLVLRGAIVNRLRCRHPQTSP